MAKAALTFTMLGCASDPDSASSDAGGGELAEEQYCKRHLADTYVAGMERLSAHARFKLRILDALPAPPGFGNNDWTAQIVDLSDAPLTGIEVSVSSLMPARGFGSGVDPVVTALSPEQSIFRISSLVFSMTGVWRITVHVTVDGYRVDQMSVEFCVES
jgi:hypothetical protein